MKNLSQILLLFSIAAMFSSCNNSTISPEPISYTSDGKCTIESSDEKTQEQLDLLRSFCDTIFVHSVVDLYKDTVYDDTLITGNEKYTSFIYLDRKTDKYDTLTNFTAEKSGDSGPCDSVPIYCTLDSSDVKKTFTCTQASICYSSRLLMSQAEIVKTRLPDPVTRTRKSVCSQPGYRCVIDSVYHTFHTTYRTKTRDTTFLNYGPKAWTDYVPAINAPAFDTAAFRNALDTLDTQNEIFGMDTLFTGYSVSVKACRTGLRILPSAQRRKILNVFAFIKKSNFVPYQCFRLIPRHIIKGHSIFGIILKPLWKRTRLSLGN